MNYILALRVLPKLRYYVITKKYFQRGGEQYDENVTLRDKGLLIYLLFPLCFFRYNSLRYFNRDSFPKYENEPPKELRYLEYSSYQEFRKELTVRDKFFMFLLSVPYLVFLGHVLAAIILIIRGLLKIGIFIVDVLIQLVQAIAFRPPEPPGKLFGDITHDLLRTELKTTAPESK